jgi:hypothetical protein
MADNDTEQAAPFSTAPSPAVPGFFTMGLPRPSVGTSPFPALWVGAVFPGQIAGAALPGGPGKC